MKKKKERIDGKRKGGKDAWEEAEEERTLFPNWG